MNLYRIVERKQSLTGLSPHLTKRDFCQHRSGSDSPQQNTGFSEIFRQDLCNCGVVLGALIGMFRPDGPYWVVKLSAEQGSGKTTFVRVLRSLIDPNTSPTRAQTTSEKDLFIAANNSWVLSFDNVSFVGGKLSDAFCRLATGGGFSTRSLYTDDDETIIDVCRPILLNGITDVGTRSDLLDRSLVIELPPIASSNRTPESVFNRRFSEASPRILGALLDAVVVALQRLPEVEQCDTDWPRMADAAIWATAAEPGLELPDGAFLDAYTVNREDAVRSGLESSPVFDRLIKLLAKSDGGSVKLTPAQLKSKLEVGIGTKVHNWPKSPAELTNHLKRIMPSLREVGIIAKHGKSDGKRYWQLIDSNHQPSDQPSTQPQGELAKKVSKKRQQLE